MARGDWIARLIRAPVTRYASWILRSMPMPSAVMKATSGQDSAVRSNAWGSTAPKNTTALGLLRVSSAPASSPRLAERFGGYEGTGENRKRGYVSDGRGGYTGTGKNQGRGLESDGRGGFIGTGDNAGGGWEPDGYGGYKGTGNNRGERWRPD